MASRASDDQPAPTSIDVTVRGGPAGADPPSRPRRPSAVLALAALVVVAGVVLGQREATPPPAPACRAPCPEPGALVLGAALPLTGVLAPFGTAQQRGVQRVLDRVAADGGLEVAGDRRRVELLVRDTTSSPDVAGQQALVLVRGPYGLLGLIGPCSPPLAMARVAESRRVPLVTGCQPLPATGVRGPSSTWEVAPGEPQRAAAVLTALRTPPGARTGLFLSNDRSQAPWTSAAAEAGSQVVGTYRPQGRQWTAAVAQAARDGVDVVIAVTQPPDGIELWQELRRQGVEPLSAYVSEAGLGSAWRTAVGAAGDGTLTDVVHPDAGEAAGPADVDEAVAKVSAELTEVLLDGLRRARTPDRTGLQEALAAAGGRVGGVDVRFSGGSASRLPVRLGRWEDGRLTALSP